MYPVFGLKVLYGSVVAILSLNEVEFVLAGHRPSGSIPSPHPWLMSSWLAFVAD